MSSTWAHSLKLPVLFLFMSANLNQPQPPPQPNSKPAVWDLVIADMRQRDEHGTAHYGTRLQPHNGRDALVDAYQEVLDAAAYLRQVIFERDGQ